MEIIILLIIIALLVVILFFALKKIIDSITTESKDYYLKKVQDLDKEILAKKEELDNLSPEVQKEILKEEKREVQENKLDKDLLDVINKTDYESRNLIKIASQVDDIFDIDEEKIIADFVQKVEINNDYNVAQKLRDRFSPNLIYKLKMLNSESQVKAIEKMISDEEYEIFNDYLKIKKFKFNRFLLDLDEVIENNKPIIEIIVGSHKKNYENLSPYIRMTYSDEIYKGFIIKYQDHIYDYSINERDV